MERSIIKHRAILSRITFQYIYTFSTSVELIDVRMFILSSFCPVVEAFRTDSSYFLHSRIVFDVEQSWERVPLPYLDGEYSKISWFFFMFGVFCSRKQRFLSLFVWFGAENDISSFFSFVWEVETLFLVAFGIWGKEKPCFLVPIGWVGRINMVSMNIYGGIKYFIATFALN